ncbi:MAG: recombinase RecT [Deltaproteobacteria bacterium]|nr:recombinase RecT [Deltaproteobacteria bacterium]
MNDLSVIGDNIKIELQTGAVKTPKNYSLENAIKAAYLILQETQDRNKKPALEVCTPESIHDALLNMAVLGLNPIKKQCYFVVYGRQLQMIMSYMGAQMVAKNADPRIADIRAQVIYSGDEIEMEIINGRDVIKSHKRPFSAISKADIIGAYAMAVGQDESVQHYAEIMTMDDIKASWKQSKMTAVAESGAINQSSTHGKFTGEMARRTVINRLCKRIINTSDDSELLKAVDRSDEDQDQPAAVERIVRKEANKIALDFDEPPKQLPPAEPEPDQASDEQCKKIYDLEKAANRAEKVLETVGGFVGRPINGLKELTKAEASEYISVVEQDFKNSGDKPDWAE